MVRGGPGTDESNKANKIKERKRGFLREITSEKIWPRVDKTGTEQNKTNGAH